MIWCYSEKHPSILTEFRAGKFAVCKTSNIFSAMAIDQCHEQNNAIIKESGGAIGLTSNPGALRRWMVAGPEVARMVTEFESYAADSNNGDITNSHHEQHPGVQASFLKDVKSLIAVFIEMGNPFLERGQDLLVLDTKDIMNISVGETVRKAEALGEEQYKNLWRRDLSSVRNLLLIYFAKTSCHFQSSISEMPFKTEDAYCNT